MPVVFEQPQAIAPAISSAYGAGEQAMSDFPAIAQAYGNAARMNQATNLASAENATRMAMANAQNIQQGGMFAGQLAQRQREGEQQQQMHNDQVVNAGVLQQQQAQAHLIAQQQAAQLNAWASQQDITFKEQQQLNLLKSKVADVQNDPNLSADEKTRILSMIKYKVDPLQMKAQATQQRIQEQQLQQMMLQHKQQTAMLDTQARLHSMTAQQRTETVQLPDGSVMNGVRDPVDGKVHWFEKSQAGAGKTFDSYGLTPHEAAQQFHEVSKAVDAAVKDGGIKPEDRDAEIEKRLSALQNHLAKRFPPPVDPQARAAEATKRAEIGTAQTEQMIDGRRDLSEPQKQKARAIVAEMRAFPRVMTPAARQRFLQLDAELAGIIGRAPNPERPGGMAVPGQAPAGPVDQNKSIPDLPDWMSGGTDAMMAPLG